VTTPTDTPAPLPLPTRLSACAMRMKSAAKFSTPGPFRDRQVEIADMLQEAADRIRSLEAELAGELARERPQ
jgi:hypothetical protein